MRIVRVTSKAKLCPNDWSVVEELNNNDSEKQAFVCISRLIAVGLTESNCSRGSSTVVKSRGVDSFVFKTCVLYVVLAVLKLTMQTRLVSNSKILLLCLLSTEIKGIHPNTWQLVDS